MRELIIPCNFIAEVDEFWADDPNVKVLIDGYRQDKIKFTTGAVVPISSAGDWESYFDYICTGRKFGDREGSPWHGCGCRFKVFIGRVGSKREGKVKICKLQNSKLVQIFEVGVPW